MKQSVVFLYCPLFEFHTYTKFGFFVRYLKYHNDYKNKTLVVCIPEEAIGCVPFADILMIYCHPDKLSKYLNITSKGNKFCREDWFTFLFKAEEILKRNFNIEEKIIYDEEKIEIKNKEIQKEFSYHDLWNSYEYNYLKIKELMNKNDWLKPYKKDYQNIKKEMEEKNIFLKDNKNYILITRNFINKQPESNTDKLVPNLKELIQNLVDNKINIINIGFPPVRIDIKSEYYKEINESYSQSELMSIFYLSDGILLSAFNSGFIPISLTLNNIFILTEEWSVRVLGKNYCVENWRKEFNKIKTINFIPFLQNNDFNTIINSLKSINKPKLLKSEMFAKEQEIYYFEKEK